MKRGQITIFLSLLLSVICGLLLIIVESTRVSAMRMQMESAMDLGLHSVLAEYNRTLLMRYDLFYIDTSYLRGEADPERLKAHLQDYTEANLKTGETQSVSGGDWFRMSVENTETEQLLTATDHEGRAFQRQALHYVRQNRIGAGSESGSVIMNRISTAGSDRDLSGERSEAESQIKEIKMPEAISMINALRGKKTVELVTGSMSVSDKSIVLQSTISHRSLRTGKGNPPFYEETGGAAAENLLELYLFDKCSDFTVSKGQGVLDYEIEYILAGRDCDRENLELITSRLLKKKEAANVGYLFSDAARMEEAKKMAVLLTAGFPIPGLVEAVTRALIYAWGYAEAILDVNRLLCGGRVPAVKSSADWRLPLKDLLKYRSYLGDGGGSGYSYEDYLKAELAGVSAGIKRMRCLDIIEANVGLTDHNPDFRMDACIEYVTANLTISSGYGYTYTIRRSYGYEPR